MKAISLAIFFWLLTTFQPAHAQDTPDLDKLFRRAQQLGFDGHYEDARVLIDSILLFKRPNTDAELFKANTWLWQKEYSEGTRLLQQLQARESENQEVALALLKAYVWSAKNDSAISLSKRFKAEWLLKGDFQYYTALAYFNLGAYENSLAITEKLFQNQSAYPGIRALHEQNIYHLQRQHLLLDYQFSSFNDDIPDWHWLSLEYGKQLRRGPLLFRLTQISRFNLDASQFELEYYPRINDKTYLYAGAGLAQGVLFPSFRAGLEAFREIGNAFELSAGFRHLGFSDAPVTSYTLSLSKYHKAWWLSLRPFIIPAAGNVYLTSNLQIRRYLNNSRHWLNLTAGIGNSPDLDFRLNAPDSAPSDQLFVLDATLVRLDYQHPMGFNWLFRSFAEYKNEEFLPGNYRTRYTLGIALQRFF
ncbi:MAG: YaiO family outer membrane beta-barrel protein [Bacteroidia bacterium]